MFRGGVCPTVNEFLIHNAPVETAVLHVNALLFSTYLHLRVIQSCSAPMGRDPLVAFSDSVPPHQQASTLNLDLVCWNVVHLTAWLPGCAALHFHSPFIVPGTLWISSYTPPWSVPLTPS